MVFRAWPADREGSIQGERLTVLLDCIVFLGMMKYMIVRTNDGIARRNETVGTAYAY